MKLVQKLSVAALSAFVMLVGSGAQQAEAHSTRLGWKGDSGGLTFYSTTYHSLSSVNDDFINNPSGIILNGTNYTFDAGSAVASTFADWQALDLDNEILCQIGSDSLCSTSNQTTSLVKRASVFLSTTELASLGLSPGSNTVAFNTFGPNVDWIPAGTFGTSEIAIELPSPAEVPTPALLPGLIGMGVAAMRKRKQATS